jgi:hypothetical protein
VEVEVSSGLDRVLRFGHASFVAMWDWLWLCGAVDLPVLSLARALEHAGLEMNAQERVVEVKLPSCGVGQI